MLNRLPSARRLARLNRRQRKKLRVGEFQERVIDIRITLRAPATAQEHDAFLAAFMQLIESRHAAPHRHGGLYVLEGREQLSAWWRGAPTAADRAAVQAWLEQRPEVAGCEVGVPVDAWYDQP
ncbi:MAG: hypothetical protein RJA36_3324 [Pseudomonadota bacterium]|jgi:uncharacterized protein YggL (DUF469 family)